MNHNIPENLKYTKEHEWLSLNGDIATVGITDFAQSSLGDIVFIELPEVGTTFDQSGTFGVVESIKSVSDLYSPIAGEVIESNTGLADDPEACNTSPYESWMIKLKVTDASQVSSLMSSSDYQSFCSES